MFNAYLNSDTPRRLRPTPLHDHNHTPLQLRSPMNMPLSPYLGNIQARQTPINQTPTQFNDQPQGYSTPSRRELSVDIRPNNLLIDGMMPRLPPKASSWNHINIPESFGSLIKSPSQRILHHHHHYSNPGTIIQQSSQISSNPTMIDTAAPQYSQLSLRGQEKGPLDMRFEAHFDRQNRMMSQLLNVIAKQEEREKEQNRMMMNQKVQEMELDKIKAAIELEKQKTQRAYHQKVEELNKKYPKSEENLSNSKKELTTLEKVVRSLVLKKSSSNAKTMLIPESLDHIKGAEEVKDVEEQEGPRFSRPRLISRGATLTTIQRPTPILRSKKTTLQNIDQAVTSLDLNAESSSSNTTRFRDSSINSALRNKKRVEFSGIGYGAGGNKNEEEPSEIIERRRLRKKSSRKENEEEVERKSILKKKKRIQGKLASLTWLLVYPKVLYNETKKHIMSEREEFEKDISSNMGQILELSKQFIQEHAGKEIQKMLMDISQGYVFANMPLDKAKKCEKMCSSLMIHFKVIFNKLIVNIGNMSADLIQLFKGLTKEDGFLQHDYFSLFEINRMKFGPFGTIREMTPQRAKLFIGGIFLVRVLLYSFIMRPWETSTVKKSQFKLEKILNIGSILYHAVIGVFKTTVPAYPNNQAFLSVDLKTRNKRNIHQALDEPLPTNVTKIEKDLTRDCEIISGFYAGHQLSSFFDHHKKMTDELKQLMIGWLDAVYERMKAEEFCKFKRKK